MVESQPRRGGIDMRRVQDRTVRRHEALAALIPEVVFRGPQAVPVGGRLDTGGIDRDQVLVDALGAGVGKQSLHDHFGLFVVAFTEAVVADLSLGVDEVQGWPVVVGEGTPDRIVVVDHDRVVDPQVPDGSADVVQVVLEVELGRVHANDHESVLLVPLGPGADIGEGA
jgi:hypothetical protein